MAAYPVIDLASFLNQTGGWEAQCTQIAELLHQFGILIVKSDMGSLC
jgi:hypothetical protein